MMSDQCTAEFVMSSAARHLVSELKDVQNGMLTKTK